MGSQLKLTYKNKQIASERNPKFLGVTLDPSLSLRQYTQNTVERAQKRINLIKSIKGKRWGASSKLIMTTYNALVRPILEYVPYAIKLQLYQTRTYSKSSSQESVLLGLAQINQRHLQGTQHPIDQKQSYPSNRQIHMHSLPQQHNHQRANRRLQYLIRIRRRSALPLSPTNNYPWQNQAISSKLLCSTKSNNTN